MPVVKAKPKGKGGATAQSIRFPIDKWSKAEAAKWCREHGYITSGYEKTENQHRFRQFQPELCARPAGMKELPNGIQMFMCIPKKSALRKESFQEKILESAAKVIKKIMNY